MGSSEEVAMECTRSMLAARYGEHNNGEVEISIIALVTDLSHDPLWRGGHLVVHTLDGQFCVVN